MLVCSASVRSNVRFATPAEAENLQILKMGALDFVALGLASMIVALTMSREVRDINIGKMLMIQAFQRDQRKKHDRPDVPDSELELDRNARIWAYLLGIPVAMRRYLVLPYIVAYALGGLWTKELLVREQPSAGFRFEALVEAYGTAGDDRSILKSWAWSTSVELNDALGSRLRPCDLQAWEEDFREKHVRA